MKKSIFFILTIAAVMAVLVDSCSKSTPAPTAVIYATITDYQVTFNPTVTDVTSYSWNFGDGPTLSTESNPVHTYESFGDYTVSLTVTGDGGTFTTTKIITIEATSVKDLLTGGASATNGKTWILSSVASIGFDGGGPIMTAPYDLTQPAPDDALTMFGLGEEYDNEFTFYFNGDYKMNLINGNALTGLIFANAMGLTITAENGDIGMGQAAYTVPNNATWTLNTDPLVIDAIGDPNDPKDPPAHENVTITSEAGWISLSQDAFFGILDFPTTTKFVIDEISSNKMKVSMFLCGYWSIPDYFSLPSNMIHLTYIKK
jgi:PKD repeat protein